MEIEFHDRKLRQLSENLALQNRSLGADCAKKLRTRLSDLEAAANVQELTAGHPHPLTGTRASQFSLNLTGGVRLVFVANHEPAPLTDRRIYRLGARNARAHCVYWRLP